MCTGKGFSQVHHRGVSLNASAISAVLSSKQVSRAMWSQLAGGGGWDESAG